MPIIPKSSNRQKSALRDTLLGKKTVPLPVFEAAIMRKWHFRLSATFATRLIVFAIPQNLYKHTTHGIFRAAHARNNCYHIRRHFKIDTSGHLTFSQQVPLHSPTPKTTE